MIEASTTPEHLDEFFDEVARLLREHAEPIDPVGLERARNQIAVRSLCAREAPAQRLELAALDLFALARVRSRDELLAGIAAVSATQVREAFARMFDAGAAVGSPAGSRQARPYAWPTLSAGLAPNRRAPDLKGDPTRSGPAAPGGRQPQRHDREADPTARPARLRAESTRNETLERLRLAAGTIGREPPRRDGRTIPSAGGERTAPPCAL